MGQLRRIMITGASGFIGRATVSEALERGLEVVAVVRSTVPPEWKSEPRIAVMRCDLSDASEAERLADAMHVDAVIHAAAHVGQDREIQNRDSIAATETLLRAITLSGVKRLVLVSSIAVYDTSRVKPRSDLTEKTPLEDVDNARDGYVAGKLAQEMLCQRAAERRGLSLCILRPGAVYGPGQTWNAHLGSGLGPLLFRFGGRGGVLPIAHLSTVAAALVAASTSDAEGAFNLLDDDLPRRRRFLRAHRASGWPSLVIGVPWRFLLVAAWVARQIPGRKPGLLQSRIIRARMMPLNYPNSALRAALIFPPSPPFEDLMARSLDGTQ